MSTHIRICMKRSFNNKIENRKKLQKIGETTKIEKIIYNYTEFLQLIFLQFL